MQKLAFLGLVLLFIESALSQNQNYFTGDRKSTPKFTVKNSVLRTDSLLNNPIKIALSQTMANYILLDNEQVQEAMEDIKSNISFEDFIKKYACKRTEKGLSVTRFKYKDHENRDVTEFTSLASGEISGHHMNFTGELSSIETNWVVDHRERSDFSNEAIQAFYFTGAFSPLKMPVEYENLVQQTVNRADTTTEFLRKRLSLLDTQLAEAKQLQASWLLLSQTLTDKTMQKKRRDALLTGVLNLLPVVLLSVKK